MANIKTVTLLWQSMRPHQWLKNVFILSGLIFGRAFNDSAYVLPALLGVIAFTLVASAGYILNDLLDQKIDIQHQQKSHRPIASGNLDTNIALIWMFSLLFIGLSLGFYISFKAFALLIAYCLLTVAYSIKFKNIPWLEIICIVMGFVLRVLLGTYGVGIPASVWVINCSALLALFLILVKRRSEQLVCKKQPYYLRIVLNIYQENWLDKAIYLAAFLCFLAYAFYAMLHGVSITIIFVALGIWRYLFLLQLRSKQAIELDAAHEFFQDSILQVIVVLWVLALVWLLYAS